MNLLIGGRYDVIDNLGAGAFGEVFRVCDTRQSPGAAELAMKMMSIHRLKDDASRSRFKREIGIAAHLSHPNVIDVVDSGLNDDIPWYVMPLADGGSLYGAVPSDGFDADRVFHEVQPIAEGVKYLHRSGVIHRDLSPNNVLRFNGVWKLTDFGLSVSSAVPSSYQTSTEASGYGSPAFISPEQRVRLSDATVLSDIYGLGKIVQFLSEGAWPVFPPRTNNPFFAVVTRATRMNPRDRFQSVDELLNAVRVVATAPPPSGSIADRVDAFLGPEQRIGSTDEVALMTLLASLSPDDEYETAELARLIPAIRPVTWAKSWQSDPDRTIYAVENVCRATKDEATFTKLDGILFCLLAADEAIDHHSVRHAVIATLAQIGSSNDRWSYRKPLIQILRDKTPPERMAATVSGLTQAGGAATQWIFQQDRVESLPQPLRGWLVNLMASGE